VNPTVADLKAYENEKAQQELVELASLTRENPACLVQDCPAWTRGKCAGCPYAWQGPG